MKRPRWSFAGSAAPDPGSPGMSDPIRSHAWPTSAVMADSHSSTSTLCTTRSMLAAPRSTLESGVPKRLAIHCSPPLTPKQATRLGRLSHWLWFGVANRTLGALVATGGCFAISMITSWGVLLLNHDGLVWRVLVAAYGTMIGCLGVLLIAGVTIEVVRERVLNLERSRDRTRTDFWRCQWHAVHLDGRVVTASTYRPLTGFTRAYVPSTNTTRYSALCLVSGVG